MSFSIDRDFAVSYMPTGICFTVATVSSMSW
jgi:hypothetical protein